MNPDPRGTISQQGVFLRAECALVGPVSTRNGRTGHLLISYAVSAPNQPPRIQTVRLNVSANTIILGADGRPASLEDIQSGMFVDAVFSQMMTRSIPPQSNAFFIMIRRTPESAPGCPAEPGRPSPPNRPGRPTPPLTMTGRIFETDLGNNRIILGNSSDPNDQTVFILTPDTTIANRIGRPVRTNALRRGQRVEITHADFQTASIPPQTTAFHIQIL